MQVDDAFFNCLKSTKKLVDLFQAVEEPIILMIFEDAARLQLGCLGLFYVNRPICRGKIILQPTILSRCLAFKLSDVLPA